MITADGYLVTQAPLKQRFHVMYMVGRLCLDPELNKTHKPSWFKFFSMSFQYILFGSCRVLEEITENEVQHER